MRKPTSAELKHAESVAGWRERYAMQHGTPRAVIQGGALCFRFEYSKKLPYQDANGAQYDTTRQRWTN